MEKSKHFTCYNTVTKLIFSLQLFCPNVFTCEIGIRIDGCAGHVVLPRKILTIMNQRDDGVELLVCLAQRRLEPRLEKTRFFKNQPSRFFWFFWVFRVFWVFFVFFIDIFPEERVFRVFSVSRILLGASRL
jgi:hypothetical protein